MGGALESGSAIRGKSGFTGEQSDNGGSTVLRFITELRSSVLDLRVAACERLVGSVGWTCSPAKVWLLDESGHAVTAERYAITELHRSWIGGSAEPNWSWVGGSAELNRSWIDGSAELCEVNGRSCAGANLNLPG